MKIPKSNIATITDHSREHLSKLLVHTKNGSICMECGVNFNNVSDNNISVIITKPRSLKYICTECKCKYATEYNMKQYNNHHYGDSTRI